MKDSKMSGKLSKDRIAVVIVHFNTDDDTTACLKSLSKVKADSFEMHTFLIDNGSKEPYVVPEGIALENFQLLRSEANLGFTGGTNMGIQHAFEEIEAEYVLLLNSDTLVKPSFLEKLYQAAQKQPSVGVFNPLTYFAKGYEYHSNSYRQADLGKVIWFAGGALDWEHVNGAHRGVDEVDRGHFKDQTGSDFATGCCVLIRREVIEAVGLFDESLFLYWEDVDYSLRVKQAGYKLTVVPESIIWHKNAGSSDGAGSRISQYYQTRNRLTIGFRYGSWQTKLNSLRLVWRYLQESDVTRTAVIDALVGNMGKRPVI